MSAKISEGAGGASETTGSVSGVTIATVTRNNDPEGLGRVMLRFLWHRPSDESGWARVAVPAAGANQGFFFVPDVGQEVLVAFERDDVRFPIVIGALWNGKAKPPGLFSGQDNSIRAIRSRQGHELRFDDTDKGGIELKLKDGKRVTISDEGILLDDGKNNSITIETKGGTIKISSKGSLTLKAANVSIQSDGAFDLKAGGTMTIRGSLVQIN
ncbi:MAG TPA: phage tail protein [Alphaproteobacteria bacterium]|nr:phage tail protein [Alphaproteobacteria bacterium]